MSNNYNIFFSGEICENFELESVKSSFKSYLNLSESQTEQYFSGTEVILQKNLSQIDALNLITKLDDIGGVCYFLPIDNKISLPDDIISDRRINTRRKVIRRINYRAGDHSDRRYGFERRAA